MSDIKNKTKEQIIKEYGEPNYEADSRMSFFANTYEEHCAIMGGLKARSDSRLEWNKSKFNKVAYVKVAYVKNDIVIAEF